MSRNCRNFQFSEKNEFEKNDERILFELRFDSSFDNATPGRFEIISIFTVFFRFLLQFFDFRDLYHILENPGDILRLGYQIFFRKFHGI